jgi:hypothetical protein
MAMFGLGFVLFALAVVVRGWKIGQWVPYRLYGTSRGVYIAPHFVLSYGSSTISTIYSLPTVSYRWQVFSAVFLAVLIPYAWITVLHARSEYVGAYMLWVCLFPWDWVHVGALSSVRGILPAPSPFLHLSRPLELPVELTLHSFVTALGHLCRTGNFRRSSKKGQLDNVAFLPQRAFSSSYFAFLLVTQTLLSMVQTVFILLISTGLIAVIIPSAIAQRCAFRSSLSASSHSLPRPPYSLVTLVSSRSRCDTLYGDYTVLRHLLNSFSASFSASTPPETVEAQIAQLVTPLQRVLDGQERLTEAWKAAWGVRVWRLATLVGVRSSFSTYSAQRLSSPLRRPYPS